MKNNSLIINVVLGVAVVVLYILHFSGGETQTSNTEGSPVSEPIKIESNEGEQPVAVSSNIGYINIDSLQDKYSLYDEMLNKLKAKQTRYEREFSSKMKSFEDKVQEFQKNAATMSQFEGQMKQKELAEEEQKLYKLREDFAVKFQGEEMKLNEEFEKTVKEFIRKHNTEKNYDIIIGASQMGNIVLDYNQGIDITNTVVDGLNAEYNSGKQKDGK